MVISQNHSKKYASVSKEYIQEESETSGTGTGDAYSTYLKFDASLLRRGIVQVVEQNVKPIQFKVFGSNKITSVDLPADADTSWHPISADTDVLQNAETPASITDAWKFIMVQCRSKNAGQSGTPFVFYRGTN